MNRTRLAVGIAIPVLLAVALALFLLQGRRPAGEAAPATTAAPVITVPPPTTTTRVEPPKATGEDWLAIVREILSYRHSLYENPRPNLLDQIYDRRCPCYAQEQKVLADLERRGWRYNDKGVTVLKTKLLGRGIGAPPSVALDVVERIHAQVLLDRSGKVRQQRPESAAKTVTYELVQGADRRWRVSFIIPR